jgi:hypothetical protein
LRDKSKFVTGVWGRDSEEIILYYEKERKKERKSNEDFTFKQVSRGYHCY